MQYDRMAGFYNRLWRDYIARTLSLLKTWAQIPPGQAVLDVACGIGVFEHMLLTDCAAQQTIGVDISPQMLLIAERA